MSIFNMFHVAGSALTAQSVRLNAVASNMANADSITSADGTPYRAKQVVFEATPMGNESAQGVRVKQVVESAAPPRMVYDPKNPAANAEAFREGWFRTGDQGVMDAEGYVSITGRLKEIINRGGEKISPREVDEVLMDHAAVAQVVCFAVPHPKLGEEVGAVVVLREGASATERELQQFAAQRLADFKVPAKILFMAEIPKGATGKLQRIGLAQKLGLA